MQLPPGSLWHATNDTVWHALLRPAPAPCVSLLGGGTGTYIKSHFTAQLNRSGGAARFNHSQKESNKAAKEMREIKKEKERERVGEG